MVTESNKTQNVDVELSVDLNTVIADEMRSAESAPPLLMCILISPCSTVIVNNNNSTHMMLHPEYLLWGEI